jgi:hypothetical protein
MTIERHYTITAIVTVPMEHSYSESVRAKAYMKSSSSRNTPSHSDLLTEEIRQLFRNSGLSTKNMLVQLTDWFVYEEEEDGSIKVFGNLPAEEIQPQPTTQGE